MKRKLLSKSTFKQTYKKVLPFAGSIGVISDVAAPMASLSIYFTIGAAILTFLLGFYWVRFYNHDEKWSLDTGLMPRGVVYSGLSFLVFSFFSVSQAVTGSEDKGVMAKMVPGIDKVQESLFKIEKTTQEMNVKLDRIEEQMDKKYTLAELNILADQEMWEEALEHMEDIPPLKRDTAWKKTLENIVVGWLYDYEYSENQEETFKKVSALFRRFRVLKKSEEAMAYRKRIGIKYIEKCLMATPVKNCESLAWGFVRYDRKRLQPLAYEVGALFSRHRFARAGVPFFDVAVTKETASKFCGQERLGLSVQNGLGSRGRSVASASQRLAGLCFSNIKPVFDKELSRIQKTSHLSNLICDLYKQNGESHSKCAELKVTGSVENQ